MENRLYTEIKVHIVGGTTKLKAIYCYNNSKVGMMQTSEFRINKEQAKRFIDLANEIMEGIE